MLTRRLEQYFAELRSLLQQRPHLHRWERVCWYAERIAVLDHDYFEQAIAPYIEGQAASWPDSTRLIPARWLHHMSAPELPDFLRICRGISLRLTLGYELALDDLVRACVELELSCIDSFSIQWDERSLRRVLLAGHVRHIGLRAGDELRVLIDEGVSRLESLNLYTDQPDVFTLLREASWSRLRHLVLMVDLQAHAHAPAWGDADSAWVTQLGLESLTLSLHYSYGHQREQGWYLSLFASPTAAPTLKRLSLQGIEPCDDLERWMLSLPPSLEELELEFIASPPPQTLSRGLRSLKLRELVLYRVEQVGQALDAWLFSSQAQALERLELVRCGHADVVMEHLCSPAAPRGLRELILSQVTLERPLSWPLRPAPWHASIETLSLRFADGAVADGASMMLLGWPMPNLLELELRWLGPAPESAALKRSAPMLHSLNLDEIDAQGVAFVADSAPEGLVELSLSGAVLASLSGFISSPVLRRLERWTVHDYRNDVSDEDIDALLTQLATTPGAAQLLYLDWPRSPQPQTLEQIRRSTSLNARFTLSFISEDLPRRVWFSRASQGGEG